MSQNHHPEEDLFAPLDGGAQTAMPDGGLQALLDAAEADHADASGDSEAVEVGYTDNPDAQTTPAERAEAEDDATADAAPAARASAEGATPAPKKKKKRKKKVEPEKKGLMARFHELVSEEDAPLNFQFNLKAIISGEGLPAFFRKNWGVVLVCVVFALIYITCGYTMNHLIQEQSQLRQKRLDSFYKVQTVRSQLYERTLGSKIEKALRDSTLHTSTDRAFQLIVPKEK